MYLPISEIFVSGGRYKKTPRDAMVCNPWADIVSRASGVCLLPPPSSCELDYLLAVRAAITA